MVFKQLLQAEAIDVCQIDSCRMSGVNEILGVLLMAAKFGVPVCPHAGGVGLCEYVIHCKSFLCSSKLPLEWVADTIRRRIVSLIDYICVSGSADVNVLEYVDHLHEHFETPCTINSKGHYNVRYYLLQVQNCTFTLFLLQVPLNPNEGYSIEIKEASKAEFVFPHGSYWSSPGAKIAHNL